MKTIYTAANGALTITEQGGVFSINISESAGGGNLAGFVKGTASIQVSATQALQAAEALLNAHLPASLQALAPAVEAIVNTAVAALE